MPFKTHKTMFFSSKVQVVTEDGPYTIPFEIESEAEAEAQKYEDGDNALRVDVLEWDETDQGWWDDKKLTLVATFGEDYLDDKRCLGMLKLFQPCYKKK